MQIDLKSKKLKKVITELGLIRGRHTELISVYVPAGFNLPVVVDQLRQEQTTAQNIKSKTVRKNVLSALEKILGHLKLYKTTPKNGLVIFCGNISKKEGDADVQLFSLELPEPVKVRLYRCDQTFILDPLEDIVREKEVYGLVVLDKSEADIGILRGKKIELVKHLDSLVPGKTKKGGQSAARFARVREGLLFDFLKNVGEIASDKFKQMPDLKGILIGGPGPIKEMFAGEEFLQTAVKNKILGLVTTSYTREYGLREAVERADKIIAQASVIKEKKILDRFFEHFAKDTGLATYGLEEVTQTLKAGNVDILLISEGFDWVKVSLVCGGCDYKTEKVLMKPELAGQRCPKCNQPLNVTKEEDISEELLNIAEQMGTTVIMISIDTPKGIQLKELGGIAAILRFKT